MNDEKRWENHHGKILGSNNNYDTIDCTTCEIAHIIPIPSQSELDVIYTHEYYQSEKPDYIDRYIEDLEWWKLVYNMRYDLFEELLGGKKGSIADVGSGPGHFIREGDNRGWQTLGIEPSEKAAEYSKALGLNIVQEFLTEDNISNFQKFDVIQLSEVLEHIPDPKSMLNIVHKMLNDSGLMCVVVPNDFNIFQNILHEVKDFKKWWIAPPYHINYFSFDSLSNLFENCGFEVIVKESTFPIDIFLLMGDNYIGNDEIGRKSHTRRMNFELTLQKAGRTEFIRKIYQGFASLGIGREVMIVGRKISENSS